MIKKLLVYLPWVVVVTGLAGLIYLTGQQSLRLAANDPQMQVAEDLATALNKGRTLETLVVQNKVDVAESLATYVMVFDESGKPVWANATLNGKTPSLPGGVFESAKKGENRVTWQPEKGVRSAIVVVKYDKGYVMVGRSLREVEKREDTLLLQVVAAWAVILVVVVVAKTVTKRVR